MLSNLDGRMNNLDNLQYQLNNIDGSMQNVSSEVDRKMDEFLQEQLWIQEKSYQISNVDIQGNKIDVTIEWSIRDILDKEEIALLYREKGSKEWSELEVSNNGGLNYSLENTFPLNGNYETQVLAISETGKRSEKLLDLNFKEEFGSRIMINAFIHPSGQDRFDINVDIQNQLENKFIEAKDPNDFFIKSAQAYVYKDGKVMKEIDILKENRDMYSDSYNETIVYHDSIEIEDVQEEDMRSVELRVIVEDGTGFQFESTAEMMY